MAADRDPLYADTCDMVFESDQRKVAGAVERLCLLLGNRWQPPRAA